jgi:hypothetical protein
MMVIDNKYDLGDTVFIKTDKEQLERIVTGILVCPIGVKYLVACGVTDNWMYELEITTDKNIVLATTN